MEGDDRTFGANFTNEGVARLQEQITEKLKEFMGDYTDDTLVEYVIVLLKNGRRKDEAKSELHVFLGDDSDSFVTWLWDHLGSHISLYVQPSEPHQDESTKKKSAANEPPARNESHQDGVNKTKSAAKEPVGRTKSHQVVPEAEKKPSRNRRNRLWKGLVREGGKNEVHLPQSSMAVRVNDHDDPVRKGVHIKKSRSPRRTNQKRKRLDEQQPRKRDIPQVPIGGARRLLQFAVRDAVKPSTTPTEPSFKRLRSVVATATGDPFLEERPNRSRVPAGSRTGMSAAIKAASEAVNDVNKLRPQPSIFDRLGQASDFHNIINEEDDFINNGRGFHDDGDYIDEREDINFPYLEQHDINLPEDVIVSRGDIIMSSDLVYSDDGYDNVDLRAHDLEERLQRAHIDLDQSEAVYRSSVNVASSVNMETWRSPQYEDVREVYAMDHGKLIQDNDVREVYAMDHGKLIQDSDSMATKSEPWLMKENNNPVMASNGNAKPETGPRHVYQKIQPPSGVYSTVPPTEDADSRTIYISNVHFAATKDSISQHFNKFGEVLKVTILTDPASGQPKGSAYIEFMRKEAAENALSLNGTSFMSRILKVVMKSSAQPEPAPVTAWPRVARASPFPVPRFSRAPFTRGGIPSLYRPQLPIKPTRSFQWKRGAQSTGIVDIPGQPYTAPPPMTRSLTYVRTEPKPQTKA